jgi:hypothetical protein
MPLAITGSAPNSARLGDLLVSKIYSGDTQLFPTFAPSRMTKSGTSATMTTTPTKLGGGWSPDTSGFPGSSVVDDELVVQGGTSGATVDCSIVFTNSTTLRTLTMDLMLGTNTTPLATGTTSLTGFVSTTATLSATGVTLASGQHVWVRVRTNTAGNITAQANSASYVRVYIP